MIEQETFKRHLVGRDGFQWWIGQVVDELAWIRNTPAKDEDSKPIFQIKSFSGTGTLTLEDKDTSIKAETKAEFEYNYLATPEEVAALNEKNNPYANVFLCSDLPNQLLQPT